MKKTTGLTILMITAFLFSACGGEIAPTETNFIDDIHTAVAATITMQSDIASVSTAQPTTTPAPTSTLYATSTILPTATIYQSGYSYYYAGTNYGCEDAEYIKDITISDGTVFTPGETFVKTWKLQNTGSCTWTENFSIVFVRGDDMDGSDTDIDQVVYSNKKAEISVSLTAPDDEGTYVGYWRMEDKYGNRFGDLVSVEIEVVEPTATSTSTATLTSTATPTPTVTLTPTTIVVSTTTLTSTPGSTATVETTATLTSTPAPTSTVDVTPTPMPTSTETVPSTQEPTESPTETSVSDTPIPVSTATVVSTPIPTSTMEEATITPTPY